MTLDKCISLSIRSKNLIIVINYKKLHAQRHSQSNAVTVVWIVLIFLKPVFVGNVLKLNARINYVHNSSMEIEVTAESEDIVTGIKTITGTAFVTFVSLDTNGKPIHAPKLSETWA